MKTCSFILIATLATGFATAAMSSSELVIYSFPSGSQPVGRLLQAIDGSLVGTNYNGPNPPGSVFRLVEKHGKWSERTIYEFGSYNGDGEYPAAGVVQDVNGIYYGTTDEGGTYGNGTIYSLTLNGTKWTEKVLYSFTGGSDGAVPMGGLLYDGVTGTLFGTTFEAGADNCGTVYELSQSNGVWKLSTLWSFEGSGKDGCYPVRSVHIGAKNGTLIGTTNAGGESNYGTVFELAQKAGVWSEEVLYSFGYADGAYPEDIDVDTTNYIAYGVTLWGGYQGDGVLYSLNLRGNPKENVLYNFEGGSDGLYPVGLKFDKADKILFGVTEYGGSLNEGTVFEFVWKGNNWSEKLLHSFGAAGDGVSPLSRPIMDKTTGVLYGTTPNGGADGGGTVWMVSP